MDRVKQIWESSFYSDAYQRLTALEENRIFCRHDLEHFLAVARLAYLYNLEEHGELSRELIYAAALLHDMGRVAEYEAGISHELAGAQFAKKVLDECGFSVEETETIVWAIGKHRTVDASASEPWHSSQKMLLADFLRRADKKSRNCMICAAQDSCNWPMEKRNLTIEW